MIPWKRRGRWTQKSITDWALRTFGAHSPMSIGIRMNREMGELLSALEHGKPESIVEECADIQIMVSQIAERYGADLGEEVQRKMDINDTRSWVLNDKGSHQHVD